MDSILKLNGAINSFVWGPPGIILLLGTGIYLGIRLGFPQFTHIRFIVRRTLGRAFSKKYREEAQQKGEGDITSFQAAMTAVAAVVGSGNVAGVATALVMGGPGALFWMWIAALIGMATKFSEITLGIRYRVADKDGNMSGGPMYYLRDGMGQKWLGIIFSILTIPAAFVISAVVDTNTITTAFMEKIDTPAIVLGIILAVMTGIVIFGGIKSIGKVCEVISPFMGAIYILSGLVIIFLHLPEVPSAFGQIFEAAFNPQSGLGGAAGTSVWVIMRYGMARGIFSNEAGLGSGAIVHSSARVEHPCQQAIWAPVELCIDTLLVCTVTGLTIILSGLWNVGESLSGSALTMAAFDKMLPGNFGGMIVLASVFLFGYSCLITWYYYAEKAVEFFFGEKSKPYVKVLWLIMILIGSVSTLGFVWDLADTTNGLMMIPNLIGLLYLGGKVAQLKKEYFNEQLPIDKAEREAKKAKKIQQ
ncbi:alanine/glycine:cation symporter family protein [Sinanaerobacter chloroacetimidivorans]|uniref:Sodium:alanine symporter family protein n=1 Tax=Sinanaerobacter chloroacetimidivorans TaxID=2818044 RepID=A0A8J7W4K2_9FIRM|nr:sodium:alanine symporter family protein [Sinanaerobacter chloroacetimidivorans]MBR0598835.1 sodium:alanine symporter family protein [Sinanaerobacter chloroacetimidivorans]